MLTNIPTKFNHPFTPSECSALHPNTKPISLSILPPPHPPPKQQQDWQSHNLLLRIVTFRSLLERHGKNNPKSISQHVRGKTIGNFVCVYVFRMQAHASPHMRVRAPCFAFPFTCRMRSSNPPFRCPIIPRLTHTWHLSSSTLPFRRS